MATVMSLNVDLVSSSLSLGGVSRERRDASDSGELGHVLGNWIVGGPKALKLALKTETFFVKCEFFPIFGGHCRLAQMILLKLGLKLTWIQLQPVR